MSDIPVFIEFDKNGRPFSAEIQVGENYFHTYDIDYSKTYGGLLTNQSGGGPGPLKALSGETFWAAEGIPLVVEPGCTRLNELPEEYQGEIWDWADGGDTIYCLTCDDRLPTEDTYYPCEHTRWCDECAWWSTPGERCKHDQQTDPQYTESYLAGFVAGYRDGIKLDNYGLLYNLNEYDIGFYYGMDAACDDAVADDLGSRPELVAWDRVTAVKE